MIRNESSETLTVNAPVEEEAPPGSGSGSAYRVILYNDDYHGVDQVTAQLIKATGYAYERCVMIMWEAHTRGRAVCYHGTREKCHEVVRVLREIHLQCEVDCD